MTYEDLLIEYSKTDIEVKEKKFKSKAKGLCFGNRIAINKDIKSTKEKNCILAEELGHYFTSYGNIINQDDIRNVKQEVKARRWAFKKLVSIQGLIKAYQNNVQGRHELAEYLNVTEKFIEDSINYYKVKYGRFHSAGKYIICFEPFAVIEKFCDF